MMRWSRKGAIILHASVAIAYSDTRKEALRVHVEAPLVIAVISLALLVRSWNHPTAILA
jgi:hypothetical protein